MAVGKTEQEMTATIEYVLRDKDGNIKGVMEATPMDIPDGVTFDEMVTAMKAAAEVAEKESE